MRQGLDFFTYIVASQRNGTIYTGSTDSVVTRTIQHREEQFKRWRREWKFALVESENPRWLDLYGEVRLRQGPGSAEPTGPSV